MKLILTQKDIEAAVRAHVSSMLTMNDGTEMEIAFTATRGADGITAEIDINYLGLAGIREIAEDKPAPAPAPAPAAAPRANKTAPAPAAEPTPPEEAASEDQAPFEEAEPAPAKETAAKGDKGPSLFGSSGFLSR